MSDASAPALRATHLLTAAEALSEILRGTQPADAVLQALFRERRKAGSKDRAQITALVYGVLRSYFPLRAALGDAAGALELCAAQALAAGRALPPLTELDAEALARALAAARPEALSDAQRYNLPDWLWTRLARQYGATDAGALAQALNRPASVDLRVNTLKATREAAQQKLAAEGIGSAATPRSPLGLRLARRVALQATAAFREGWVEPQDEGSQLLAQFVEPRAGETVVDYCAGAGGKTLALGALMDNRGTLHALDISRTRLARLKPRAQRAGLSIVESHALRESDPALARLAGSCDAVLVDAPCSATGTLRRNPELRLQTPDLDALAATQRAILVQAAPLVKPGGGRLVYATCSVLREENEAVVEAFLAGHSDFAQAAELRLLPHRDGTDGFYAARLVKRS